MNTTEDRISKLEYISKHRSIYMKHEEQRKTKKTPEVNKKEMWDTVDKSNICITGKPERTKDVLKLYFKK